MDFVKWLPNNSKLFADMDTEAIIAQINNLASSDEGKETLEQLTKQYKNKEMGIFKEGGKLNYLLCLNKGGAIQDCGCSKKVLAKQPGGVVESDVSEQFTPITFIKRPMNSGNHFYDKRIGEDGTIVEEVAAGDDPNLSYIRVQFPATEGYPARVGYYVGGYDESGYKSTDHWGFGQQKKGKKLFDENYQRILSQAKARELRREYGPVGLPMMDNGGEISRRDTSYVAEYFSKEDNARRNARKQYRSILDEGQTFKNGETLNKK